MSSQTTLERNGVSREDGDTEHQKKIKYPKSVFFIISNEFCERFSYYGMKTILALYFQYKLRYSETDATLLYHTFLMLCYFFPLLGGIIADSYLGKFRTILYLSIIYACGSVTLSYASTGYVPISESTLCMVGLLLISMGTGGIKPCVSSFGGDQFVLPDQERQLKQFFSVFYFSINAGSLISTFLTPELRQGVKCMGQDTCYPLAFGIPAVLMIFSLIIFVAGKPMYKMKTPTGNVMVDVFKCSVHAVKQKISSKQKKEHWLDYASGKFSPQLIADTKILMSIILLFSPTVLFWSLYEQQGTSWTFQATRMNGEWGSFTIKPDQMQVVNPVLILIFIPLFESLIYPLLAKLRLLRTSLQKLSVGGLLVAVAFVVAGLLEYKMQPTYEIMPKAGEAQLRIVNGYDCSVTASYDGGTGTSTHTIGSLDILQQYSLKASGRTELAISFNSTNCPGLPADYLTTLDLTEKQSVTYLLKESNSGNPTLSRIGTYDIVKKSEIGSPQLRVIRYPSETLTTLALIKNSNDVAAKFTFPPGSDYAGYQNLTSGRFKLRLGDQDLSGEIDLQFAGVYTLLLEEFSNKTVMHRLYTTTEPSTVHILWQLPQIIIITVAEIMFSITGVEFSYSQAPTSMKSVIASLWLLTDSLGNLIVVFLAELLKLDNQVMEFFMFAGLMVLVMVVFMLLAMRYKYAPKQIDGDDGAVKKTDSYADNPAFNSEE